MQQDPHPLAIIPVQKDLLLSDTSSTSSSGSSLSYGADAPSVNIRSLVPSSGAAPAAASDSALMRSLISVLPHEQADREFSVASPARRSDSQEQIREHPWFTGHSTTTSGDGDNGNSCSRGHEDDGDGLADFGLDFLGTTDSVRDLLHLPYTSEAVTVGLHRVGQTLVLDGNLGEVFGTAAAAAQAQGSAPSSSSSRRSPSKGGDAEADCARGATSSSQSAADTSTTISGGDEGGRWVMVGRGGKPRRDEDDDEGAPPPMRTATAAAVVAGDAGARGGGWSVHQSSWPALGAAVEDLGTGKSISSGTGILSIVPSRPRTNYFGGRPPEPAGFWRAFQWELDGMRLMLGSSLQICSTLEHPQVSVRLHDGDENLSLCTCLDYYLDNVMENVPELALCMREKGYIQGCRLVSTEDIPYLGSLSRKSHESAASGPKAAGGVGRSVPLFDPVVVELNATMLLRFLQENCSREGGTYLLHRSEGAAHVQLYDVSALSRQRNRRWKWLLAMLCYRFALRISHHIRQPWFRGGGPAAGAGPRGSDASSRPGPEVMRQLQRRQRQLLENSLELLEELAQLGGGGHETICASVQEHIADTYLGYEGVQGVLWGAGDDSNGAGGTTRGKRRIKQQQQKGSVVKATTAAGTSGDSEHEFPSQRSHARTPWTVDGNGEVWTTAPPTSRSASTGRTQKGRRRGAVKSETVREKALGLEGFRPGVDRQSIPGSSRFGHSDSGDNTTDVASNRKAEQFAEENLDKAQDHLTSGIAILRGVMARQEAAVAGRGDVAADVVIVGEKGVPVGVMRQERSPWLTVDDDDESSSVAHEHENGSGFSEKDRPPRRRSRRESRDESEDPATAMSVVSEQLFGLLQKLVGTYMAVARARLSRGFPIPSLAASTSEERPGTHRDLTVDGVEDLEDVPDEEVRAELVEGAIDSLCTAWEHLIEATVTLDRRVAAGVMDGEAGTPPFESNRCFDDHDARGEDVDVSDSNLKRDNPPGGQADRQDDLGLLWKGSLSEALARSGTGDGDGGAAHGTRTLVGVAASDGTKPSDVMVGLGVDRLAGKEDAIRRLAWDNTARRQLETRRAELHEICGDVAHVCIRMRAAAGQGNEPSLMGLIKRLEELLLLARPPLELDSLDMCYELHGRVLESLTSFSATSTVTTTSGRRGRSVQSSGDSCVPSLDPSPLAETCVHRLAKAGRVPAEAVVWSLHLAVEACYKRALQELGVDGSSQSQSVSSMSAGRRSLDIHQWGTSFASDNVVGARARLRKKLGNASNELGKLMAQCAGTLVVQTLPSMPESTASSASTHRQESTSVLRHPGLSCAVCVACAQMWFQRSMAEFQAIDDARNIALVLCNLASMERMKPRALARLREACPGSGTDAAPSAEAAARGVKTNAVSRRRGSTSERGAAKAVELCGDAHAVLGSKDNDRTWDHVSNELAMAYLCLGVERRQELLDNLQCPEAAVGRIPEPTGSSSSQRQASKASSFLSPPSVAQVRSVVQPLERALQIYTDMNNAPQAAACHYQIGQYYAKVLPAYVGSSYAAVGSDASSVDKGRNRGSSKSHIGNTKNATAPTLQRAKAWEVGQRAARHFLAARAYFAPFEQGPTSVVLALDLCDLYLSLANMAASGAFASSTVISEINFGASGLGEGVSYASPDAASVGSDGLRTSGAVPNATDVRRRPAVPVRYQCLEGALRSLLETRSVFVNSGVDTRTPTVQTNGGDNTTAGHRRLYRLLESMTERLLKVMQAMVRASVEMEMADTSASVLKDMYRRSMLGMRNGGEGAQAMLAGLSLQYDSLIGLSEGSGRM